MKKIVSLMLSIIITILSAVSVIAAEGTDSSGYSYDSIFLNKYMLLAELGTFEKEHSSNEFSRTVTRLEFSEYLAGLLGVKDSKLTDNIYFHDASEVYVSNLTAMGIISGCGDGNFEAGRHITSSEAICMILRALGYKEYIEARGGSAFEYSRIALRVGLDMVKDMSAELTLKDTVELFYSSLELAIMDVESISIADAKPYVTYTDSKNVSLIEFYRNIRLIRGQITATYITSIGGIKTTAYGQFAIDDTVYESDDTSVVSYIGQRVIAIYDKTAESVSYVIPDYEKMEILVLNAEEIQQYSNYNLTYQREGEKREKNIRFNHKTLHVIYNGKMIDSDFKNAFEITLGTVSLYSVDSTGNYSVAVIEEYTDMVVRQVSTETLSIYTNGDGDMSALPFEDSTDKEVYKRIFSAESGLPIGIKSLGENDLISVCCSRDKSYIIVYLCTKSVIGNVEATSVKNGTNYVRIEGDEYKISPYYKGLGVKPGQSGEFILDKFGYISYAKTVSLAASGVAYVYRVGIVDNAFSDSVKIKLYTKAKEHLVYELEESVNFDGDRISAVDAYSRFVPDGNLSKGLIKYTVNSKGKISSIDTGGSGTYFSEMTNGAETLPYTYIDRSFGENGEYILTKGTTVFVVPSGTDAEIPENFNVVSYREGMTPILGTSETVRIYQDNEDPFAEYVVYYYNNRRTNMSGVTSIHMMVEEVVEELAADGESTVTIIKGYSNCMPYEVTVTDDVQVLAHSKAALQGVDVIEPGDWILCSTNANGSVGYIMLIYNVDADDIDGYPGVNGYYESWGAETNAYYRDWDVLRVERGGADGKEALLILGDKTTGIVKDCIAFDESKKIFMIYDSTAKNGNWYQGTVDDIVSFESTNRTDCDKVLYELRDSFRLMNLAIYKY